MTYKPLLPLLHLVAVPAHHAAVIYRQRRVGYHQFLVDADDAAEALALRTGPCGRVKREHLVRRFLEGHAVGLELHREVVAYRRWEQQSHLAVPLVEGRLGRVHQSGYRVLRIIYRQTVDDKESLPLFLFKRRARLFFELLQIVVNSNEGSVCALTSPPPFGGGRGEAHPHIALLHVHLQLLLHRPALAQLYGCHHHEAGALRVFQHLLHHVLRRVLLHLLSADGRVGLADTGVEQPQVFVYLGRGAHRRARVSRYHLLFDGNGGRYAPDVVALGLVHPAQELARITRQTLHVAPLSFRIQRVEGQR